MSKVIYPQDGYNDAVIWSGAKGAVSKMRNMIIKLLQLLGLYRAAKSVKYRLMTLTPKYVRNRRKTLGFYSQFINESDLCFDVGANLGNRTEIFVKIGASVVAVEPQDICMQQLRRKYGNNDRVTLVQTALGDENGEAEMAISNASTISS